MSIEVLRIRNQNALQLPSLRNFLAEALATSKFVVDVEAALTELDYWVIRNHAGVFVVRENGSFTTFGFAQWGESAFSPYCSIIHIFNKGSRQALRALNRALVAFCKLGGYDKVMTIDMNGKPRAIGVLFREGGSPTPVGTAYSFTLSGD